MLRDKTAAGATPGHRKAPFPRRHLIALISLGLALGLGLSLVSGGDVKAHRKTIPVALPLAPATDIEEPDEGSWVAGNDEKPAENWQDITVNPGDNLSVLFARAGLSDADVHHIVRKAPQGKSLTRLYPGEHIGFLIDDTGGLAALKRRYVPEPDYGPRQYLRRGDRLRARPERR